MQPTAPKGSEAYRVAYQDEWREVFMISAEIYVFGIIIYNLLASGEKQYWADGVAAEKSQLKTPPLINSDDVESQKK